MSNANFEMTGILLGHEAHLRKVPVGTKLQNTKFTGRRYLASSRCRWRSCFRVFFVRRNIYLCCGHIPIIEGWQR